MPYTRKSIFSYDDYNEDVFSIQPPTICPMCNHAISPVFVSLSLNSDNEGSIMFFCKACSNPFISYFNYIQSPNDRKLYFRKYIYHAPQLFIDRIFPEIISNLSMRFVETYNQAAQAESLGLLEIAGPGYRKSLEILIKDYAIRKFPDKTDLIISPNYTLSQCIKDYIEIDRIKNPSIAASWLGNDATHYTKRHMDQDLKELKQYIETVIYFVQFDLSADFASDFVA